jgi:hypothetical protein
MRYDPKMGARRLVWLRTALFPIAERAERDLITRGKLLLGQAEYAPQCFNARHASSLPQFFCRHAPSIGIGSGGGLDLRLRHRPHRRVWKWSLATVAHHFDDRAVSAHFRGSSRLAHVFLPVGPR